MNFVGVYFVSQLINDIGDCIGELLFMIDAGRWGGFGDWISGELPGELYSGVIWWERVFC